MAEPTPICTDDLERPLTVRDLIGKLEQLNPDLPVLVAYDGYWASSELTLAHLADIDETTMDHAYDHRSDTRPCVIIPA